MTRPNIIRADTIDLQNQEAPSAKDHTRQPNRPVALGEGPPAPHQADALKYVELEINEQHGRSPRASQDLSGKELGLLHHEDGDSYGINDGLSQENVARNAGNSNAAGTEEDVGDVEGDESEDDMMDKISSSPSIGDDGGYHLPLPRPTRGTPYRSSTPHPRKACSPESTSDVLSSSPFYETPAHFPLSFPRNEQERTPSKDHHHHQGGYTRNQEANAIATVAEEESEARDQLNPLPSEQRASYFENEGFDILDESYEEDFDPNGFHHLLLPADDPLLDNRFDDVSGSSTESCSPESKGSWDEKQPETIDDDTEEISFVDNTRFVDSGWGGECLRETEDIDFEFVYALHTFVATVEGQANATKGDTMVLLDDSNSYWWLVRVVKDSSIGYLPAEHIETPLERLARLNKHRNLDLSQTMLGDEEEKKPGNSLNPLKRAMQRRNGKSVQFTAPSYVEPSDIEYSTDEEGEGDESYLGQEQAGTATQNNDQGREIEESAIVEPLKTRGSTREVRQNGEIGDSGIRNGGSDQIAAAEDLRTSDDTFERSGEDIQIQAKVHVGLTTADDSTAAKSRKGTVRNTDSFFKDDSVETRKINLTPSLLRDDSKGTITTSIEANDHLKARPSLDSLEKDNPPEKGKEDKKRKEKRGMLGGMFKRKDKKNRGQDKEPEEVEKTSSEVSRLSPQPKESLESLTEEAQAAKTTPRPHRQTSKLQKSPPAKLSPKSLSPKSSYTLREPAGPGPTTAEQQSAVVPEPSRAPPPVSSISESNGPMRIREPDSDLITDDTAPAVNFNSKVHSYEYSATSESPRDGRRGMFSPIKDALKSSPSDPKPEKARKAKQRMHIDDFDSTSSEDEPTEQALSERESQEESERHLAIAQDAQHDEYEDRAPAFPQVEPARERLSESPIEVNAPRDFQRTPPPEQHRTPHQPPPLMVDTSSQEDPSTSPVSPLSSPELVEAPDENTGCEETSASTAQSSTPTWSDTNLRAYLEDDSEIRDLLVVVHDKSNVKPATRDHPIVKNMYKEENRKLGEISTRLDGLLGDYLARKSRTTVR